MDKRKEYVSVCAAVEECTGFKCGDGVFRKGAILEAYKASLFSELYDAGAPKWTHSNGKLPANKATIKGISPTIM